MKDGSTCMAHKVEHAVDMETGAVVGVTIQGADKGDTATLVETLTTAAKKYLQPPGGAVGSSTCNPVSATGTARG